MARPEHLAHVGHGVAALAGPGVVDQRRAERRQTIADRQRDPLGQEAAQQVQVVDHAYSAGSGSAGIAAAGLWTGGSTPSPAAWPAMYASTRSCASSSACWIGGDFMK